MLNASPETTVRVLPRQRRERYPLLLGIVAILLLISTIVLAILYGIERNQTTTVASLNNNNLCLTPYCIKAANGLLESIDETVDPCENFYEFACGTWIKKAKIPADSSFQGAFKAIQTQVDNALVDVLSSLPPNATIDSQAINNARRLYASCVNEESIEAEDVDAILSFVNTELGGWPILQGSTWDESTFDLSRLLVKLSQHNNFIFYDVETTVDVKNSSIHCIKIGQSDLGLGDRNYYVGETKDTKAYQQFMWDLARELTDDTSMIDEDVNAIFEFEKEIAEHHWTTAEKSAGDITRTTLDDLFLTINSTFDFFGYLRRLYLLGNVTLVDTDIVIVSELEFLRDVSLIIDQHSPRTIQNYAVWRFMMNRVWHMPKRFRAIEQQFGQVLYGIRAEPSRAVTCANYVNNKMSRVVSKLYIKKYFDQSARNQALEMIDNIRNMFIDMVNQSTWMDSVSKNRTIEKAGAINEKIGYPDYLDTDNVTKLETYYAEFNFNSSLSQNVWTALRLNAKKDVQKLRESVNRKVWIESNPTDVNFYYIPRLNDIIFPAAVLQPPLFHKDAPKYLNYGGIGIFMGHEITHGFDDLRRHFDKDGQSVSMWTNQTLDEFNKRKKCIVKQYSNYTVAQVNLKINGELTQDENIADNGGLKEAFFAYQKWAQTHANVDKKLPGLAKYSAEQMFFLNFGHVLCSKITDQQLTREILTDEHSPPQYRVLGSLSNFAEFDRVFSCKPGQGNSRVNKCAVW